MGTFPLVFMIFSAATLLFLCNSIVAETKTTCDNKAKEVCRDNHKHDCKEGMCKTQSRASMKTQHMTHNRTPIGGSSECGDCLEGYNRIGSICVGT